MPGLNRAPAAPAGAVRGRQHPDRRDRPDRHHPSPGLPHAGGDAPHRRRRGGGAAPHGDRPGAGRRRPQGGHPGLRPDRLRPAAGPDHPPSDRRPRRHDHDRASRWAARTRTTAPARRHNLGGPHHVAPRDGEVEALDHYIECWCSSSWASAPWPTRPRAGAGGRRPRPRRRGGQPRGAGRRRPGAGRAQPRRRQRSRRGRVARGRPGRQPDRGDRRLRRPPPW